jgi:hypothetical protein
MNSGRFVLLVAISVWATFGLAVRYAWAQNDDGAGIVVSKKASSAHVGPPIYPGAKPHKNPGSDSDAARLGVWGGAFGFGLAVMQLESSDSRTKVAEYYKLALAKYGTVLDCTNGGKVHEDSSSALTCDDKPGKNGGTLFKAGTNENQHIVEVEQNGSGSTFAPIHLWTKGD